MRRGPAGEKTETPAPPTPETPAASVDIIDAWVDGDVPGLLVLARADERPPRGLAGRVDWEIRGELSRALRAGKFQGLPGELLYLPVRRGGRTLHCWVLGTGFGDDRATPDLAEALRRIRGLKRLPVALSRRDWDEDKALAKWDPEVLRVFA